MIISVCSYQKVSFISMVLWYFNEQYYMTHAFHFISYPFSILLLFYTHQFLSFAACAYKFPPWLPFLFFKGSIGVIASLPNFSERMKREGVDYEEVTAGKICELSLLGFFPPFTFSLISLSFFYVFHLSHLEFLFWCAFLFTLMSTFLLPFFLLHLSAVLRFFFLPITWSHTVYYSFFLFYREIQANDDTVQTNNRRCQRQSDIWNPRDFKNV